jgi:hypothetical protein
MSGGMVKVADEGAVVLEPPVAGRDNETLTCKAPSTVHPGVSCCRVRRRVRSVIDGGRQYPSHVDKGTNGVEVTWNMLPPRITVPLLCATRDLNTHLTGAVVSIGSADPLNVSISFKFDLDGLHVDGKIIFTVGVGRICKNNDPV